MIVVVADTSPINYLVLIGRIEVLSVLFEQVLIPKTVEQELLRPEAPANVRAWISNLPRWAVVRSAHQIVPLDLDPGETEAIALAKEVGAYAVLLDEGDARRVAKDQGLNVAGTLGI